MTRQGLPARLPDTMKLQFRGMLFHEMLQLPIQELVARAQRVCQWMHFDVCLPKHNCRGPTGRLANPTLQVWYPRHNLADRQVVYAKPLYLGNEVQEENRLLEQGDTLSNVNAVGQRTRLTKQTTTL